MTSLSSSSAAVAAVAVACLLSSPLAAQNAPARAPTPAQARAAALEIMKAARYATLVTVGNDGQPQARIVDPLVGTDAGSIWIATNPLSRKVREIQRNPRVTLLFFNMPGNEFVTVLAKARAIADPAQIALRWKPEWDPFYKSGKNGRVVALFEVKPFRMEIVSAARGFRNDSATWRPATVRMP